MIVKINKANKYKEVFLEEVFLQSAMLIKPFS